MVHRKKTDFSVVGGKAPVRKEMKKAGASMVSSKALNIMGSHLKDTVDLCTNSAMKYAKHAKRKKITNADMQLAIDTGCTGIKRN